MSFTLNEPRRFRVRPPLPDRLPGDLKEPCDFIRFTQFGCKIKRRSAPNQMNIADGTRNSANGWKGVSPALHRLDPLNRAIHERRIGSFGSETIPIRFEFSDAKQLVDDRGPSFRMVSAVHCRDRIGIGNEWPNQTYPSVDDCGCSHFEFSHCNQSQTESVRIVWQTIAVIK
jgi:hypothetical protein